MKRSLLLLSPLLLVVAIAALVRGDDRPRPAPTDVAAVESADPAGLGSLQVEVATRDGWQVRRSIGAGGRGRGGRLDADCEEACAPCEDGAPPPSAPMPSAAPRAKGDGGGALARRAEAAPAGGVAAGAPSPGRPTGGAPLRAGSTDDNADFAAFLAYLDGRFGPAGQGGPSDLRYSAPLDVRGRRLVRVVDQGGRPVPAARLTVLDERTDRLAWRATTQGDGAAPFYPAVAKAPAGAALVVEAQAGEARVRARWDGAADLTLTLPGDRPTLEPLALDVAFVIDTTGSMGDEIDRIQASLLAVTGKLRGLGRELDLRYGCVLYRDVGDEYLTSLHPFTSDVQAFDKALASAEAGGGGDGPESLNQGLAVAVHGLDWRPKAAKVAFLITDAPPHMDYPGDAPYAASLVAAVGRGVKVHSVAASGLTPEGTTVLRQVAQFTRGTFVFIEYGDLASTAAGHGVTGKVEGNNLDAILFERVRDEVARWGR